MQIRNILSTILLCMCVMVCSAQAFNADNAIREISTAAAAVRTLQCDFTQTKTLKMLGDKMVSKGKMYSEQPNKLRWEYTSPYTYTFILNGNRVLLKKGDRNDVVDVEQNKMFKEIARIMMNSVTGRCLTDKKDFKTTITQQGQSYVATLLPQKKEMKQMFTRIVLHYDRQQQMIVKVELHEKNGDNTVIELNNVKKNAPINAGTFQIN